MKEAFKTTTSSIIWSSFISCIIGFLMVVDPSMSIKTIAIMTALYIILQGIVLIVLDIKASKYYIPFDGMLSGILSIILGIVIMYKTDLFSTLITIIIGLWIALSSVNSIKMAVTLKDEDIPWFLLLLLGIIDLIAGIVVIFNPFEASISITIFVGIMIMVHSIINIVDMLVIRKDVKKISKAIENRFKEIQS